MGGGGLHAVTACGDPMGGGGGGGGGGGCMWVHAVTMVRGVHVGACCNYGACGCML